MKIKKIKGQYICSQWCEFRTLHYCKKYSSICLSCDLHEKLENPALKKRVDFDNEIKSQLACSDCIKNEGY